MHSRMSVTALPRRGGFGLASASPQVRSSANAGTTLATLCRLAIEVIEKCSSPVAIG